MKTQLREVTPAQARELLKKSEGFIVPGLRNRRITRWKVDELVRDMLRGNWNGETAEAIKLDKDGRLIDGRHRLTAVVKSNTTQTFLFAYDVPHTVFPYLDTGKKRSGANTLETHGAENTRHLAAIIRMIYRYDNGSLGTASNFVSLSNNEILRLYDTDRSGYDAAAKFGASYYKKLNGLYNVCAIGGIHYLASRQRYKESVELFFEDLSLYRNMNNGMKLLNQTMIKNKASLRKMNNDTMSAFIAKVWHSYLYGYKIKTLKVQVDEKFPKVGRRPSGIPSRAVI